MRTPDPTLSDLLDEPIVRAMMTADAVDGDAIRILFARVRQPSHAADAARGREVPAVYDLRGSTMADRPTRAVTTPSIDRRHRSESAPMAVGFRPRFPPTLDASSRGTRPMPDQPAQTSSRGADVSVLEPDLQVLLDAFRTPFLHVRDLRQLEACGTGAGDRGDQAQSSPPAAQG